jgi:hypothetical protein
LSITRLIKATEIWETTTSIKLFSPPSIRTKRDQRLRHELAQIKCGKRVNNLASVGPEFGALSYVTKREREDNISKVTFWVAAVLISS